MPTSRRCIKSSHRCRATWRGFAPNWQPLADACSRRPVHRPPTGRRVPASSCKAVWRDTVRKAKQALAASRRLEMMAIPKKTTSRCKRRVSLGAGTSVRESGEGGKRKLALERLAEWRVQTRFGPGRRGSLTNCERWRALRREMSRRGW